MASKHFQFTCSWTRLETWVINIHHLGLPVRNSFLLLEQAFSPTANIFDLKVSKQHSHTSKGKTSPNKNSANFLFCLLVDLSTKENIQNPGGVLIRLPSKHLNTRALKPSPFYSCKFGNEFKSQGDPFPQCTGQAPANPAWAAPCPPHWQDALLLCAVLTVLTFSLLWGCVTSAHVHPLPAAEFVLLNEAS